MSCNVIAAAAELTSPKFAAAFAAGCGGQVVPRYVGGSWAGFGSPQHCDGLQEAIAAGQDWYYGDHGYFGRKTYYRVTRNAYFHDGVGETDGRRYARFNRGPAGWRKSLFIVLCPQSDGYFRRTLGISQDDWIARTRAEIAKYTDRKVKVHYKKDFKPLADALRLGWACVTYSSNSAVEALLQGVPPICLGDCPAKLLSTKLEDIENPFYPDDMERRRFFGVLCDNQWTLEEIRQGAAWKALQDHDRIR
jgi:hypothetical protein